MSQSSTDRFTLDWLLAPISTQDFLTSHLGVKTLRIVRDSDKYYSSLLNDEDLECALALACGTRGAVEELRAGDHARSCRSLTHAKEAYQSGKSLRIVGIQRFSRTIAHLCRSIIGSLQCRVQVNLYLTPGGSRALNKHFDTHDVFVLQVHGTKLWTLYDNPVNAPLEVLPLLRHETVPDMKGNRLIKQRATADASSQLEEFTLNAGSLLYLPRGHWHNAASEPDTVSCHLTIGLQAVTYTDLLTAAVGHASLEDFRMRQSLPLHFLFSSQTTDAVQRALRSMLDDMSSRVNAEVCIGHVSRDVVRGTVPPHDNTLLKGSTREDFITPDTLVRVRSGLLLALDNSSGTLELCFTNKSFGVAASYIAAVRFIAERRELTIRELPGDIDDNQRALFVTDLLTVGVLEVVDRVDQRSTVRPGWHPIHVDANDNRVTWLDCGDDTLPEPFAKEAFERIKACSSTLQSITTDLSTLAARDGAQQPSGFIFHVSRCGSTLLSNCLKCYPSVRIFAEPQPISALLRRALASPLSSPDEMAHRLSLLKGTIEAYGSQPAGCEKSYIIKVTSWHILHLSVFRRLWPEVPFVVLLRNPLEVAVSCIDKPPGWMKWRKAGLPWEHEKGQGTSSRETFCAQMLGQFFRQAREAEGSQVRILDYENLTRETCLDTARFFGLSPDETTTADIDRTLRINSKHPHLGAFSADAASKRARASTYLKNAVDAWVGATAKATGVNEPVL